VSRSSTLGHQLGRWTFAKKRFGANSTKAFCIECGAQVVVMPQGNGEVDVRRDRNLATLPGIKGEAMFNKCSKVVPPRAPDQTLLPGIDGDLL